MLAWSRSVKMRDKCFWWFSEESHNVAQYCTHLDVFLHNRFDFFVEQRLHIQSHQFHWIRGNFVGALLHWGSSIVSRFQGFQYAVRHVSDGYFLWVARNQSAKFWAKFTSQSQMPVYSLMSMQLCLSIHCAADWMRWNWTAFATNYSSLLTTMCDAPRNSRWTDLNHATGVVLPLSQINAVSTPIKTHWTQTMISHATNYVRVKIINNRISEIDSCCSSTLFTLISFPLLFFLSPFCAKRRRKYPLSFCIDANVSAWVKYWRILCHFALHNLWIAYKQKVLTQWDICIAIVKSLNVACERMALKAYIGRSR